MTYPISFAGARFQARPSGALFWPAQGALIAADLHLGKSARMARRGGALLPPFETSQTLDLLTAEVAATDPRRVILLGDVFDDDQAAAEIPPEATARMAALARGRDWQVLAGNHDPGSGDGDVHIAGIALRHIAGEGPDISGHYHPKFRHRRKGWRCFLVSDRHLILPAFGTYTGGLWHDAPALRALVPTGLAITTDAGMLAFPVG
ncbi:ligase-associated DNA damage response endonuclease PdeM [Paracoccus jiaweipingae]|uniref:ligase-associated DNA damage response endonuclease PdeM n=1 Tax=unclassified Paracoccus (in: a-proteobacteria) TaxID=2688777 RepID=UPI003792B665